MINANGEFVWLEISDFMQKQCSASPIQTVRFADATRPGDLGDEGVLLKASLCVRVACSQRERVSYADGVYHFTLSTQQHSTKNNHKTRFQKVRWDIPPVSDGSIWGYMTRFFVYFKWVVSTFRSTCGNNQSPDTMQSKVGNSDFPGRSSIFCLCHSVNLWELHDASLVVTGDAVTAGTPPSAPQGQEHQLDSTVLH